MNLLVEALWQIANYPSGGLVVSGEASGDRDAMIHVARNALIEHYGVKTFQSAIAVQRASVTS